MFCSCKPAVDMGPLMYLFFGCVHEGSGYITESYIEEASAILKSSTTVTKVSNAMRRQCVFKENIFTRPHKECYLSIVEYCKAKRPVSKQYRFTLYIFETQNLLGIST